MQPAPTSSRSIPEGTIPLMSIEGTAHECGCRYAESIRERYPGYHRYLNANYYTQILSPDFIRLANDRAPYLIDLLRGVCQVIDRCKIPLAVPEAPAGCSSFGLSGNVTLDGHAISGQTKDTGIDSAYRYIILRIRMRDAPTILVLAYPGEILGYGLWSTGASIFRNSLSPREGLRGLSMEQWGLLALAGSSVHDAVELAQRHGIKGSGNCLISDCHGESASVEFNAGGVNIIPAVNGIATHTNHPEGKDTAAFEDLGSDSVGQAGSRLRNQRLRQLLEAERGRLTAPLALMCLADHQHYPQQSLCRHLSATSLTTAAVVAEPTRGRLHAVRGNPCSNWPATYCV